MTLFERNTAALSSAYPVLASQLQVAECAKSAIEIHRTPEGVPTAKYRGRWLHSSRAPQREAARVAADPALSAADCIICYGFGLGYHIEEIAARQPDTPLVVLEPDLGVLRAALETRELQSVLASERLWLLGGVEAVSAFASTLSALRPRRPEVRRLQAAVAADGEFFARADEALARHGSREEINRNTLKRFGRLWVRNLVGNIEVVADSPGISRLIDQFKHVPAVVCAAGPTLDELLPWLAVLRERAIIVAVDTSIVPLVRAGIAPDFLVTVDPQYWNTRHLDRLQSPRTALISESATHPRVFRMLSENPRYLCSSLFPLGQYLERALEPRGTLGAGGSVATSAWDFARTLGCDPVYTAGLDLGFPGHATHCRGSYFEELAHGFCDRLMPVERYAAQYLWDGGPRTTEAADGGRLLSDRRMLLYRWWFEAQIENTADNSQQYFSLSARSAAVSGMPPIEPGRAAAGPPVRASIDATLDRLHAHNRHDTATNAAGRESPVRRLAEDLGALIEELHALDGVLSEAVAATADAIARFELDPKSKLDLSQLDRADRAITASERREIIGFLIHEAAEEIFAESGESGETALRNSQRLYRALLDSIRYHALLFEQALERLQSRADRSPHP